MSRVRYLVLVASVLAIAGCSSQPKEIAVAPPPAPPLPTVVYAPPPVSPINRNLTAAATVWHLRAGLNVAALACRGAQEAQIIARYNALLSTHRATLASAQSQLSAEFRAGGGDWQDRYDDAMTRLYNFFSQAQAREGFCAAAAQALDAAAAVPEGGLERFAAATLPVIDAPFAAMHAPRTVIAVAAPAPAAAASAVRTPVSTAPVVARVPRLEVDVRALSEGTPD